MLESIRAWLTSPLLTIGPLVAAIGMWAGGFIIFTIRHFAGNRVSTERVKQVGGSVVLGSYLTEYGLWLFRPVVWGSAKFGIHPDVFSWGSLWLSTLAALILSQGAFGLGGWLLGFAAICDTLDGAVARARNMSSDSGEVLDAVIDRWSEGVVFVGLAWYYRDDPLGFLCASGAGLGAVAVSYARAKGESMGVVAKMGLMQRHERTFWIIMPTIISAIYYTFKPAGDHPRHWFVIVGLALIAILGNWTGYIRMRYIRQELSKQ